MGKTRRVIGKMLISLMFVLSVWALLGTGVQAEETNTEQSGKNGAYLVDANGAETKISDAELKALKEQSFSEVPEDIVLEATSEDGVLVSPDTGERVSVGDESAASVKACAEELTITSNIMNAASDITAAPNATGRYEVYSNYFLYYPFDGMNNVGWKTAYSFYDLYLEYSTDGANWTCVGPMKYSLVTTASNQVYSINGLQPNTSYFTRIFYGDTDIYGKTTYGPVVSSKTIKTGMATPPKVKSIKVKAVNVKRRKVKHYLYGVYMYTEKFYTCKLKIIVELKKKPGTPGIAVKLVGNWMGAPNVTFVLGGNKKKYSKTFNPYPNYFFKNPRKRGKCQISVCSCQSNDWGGLSPVVTKVKRLS